VALNAAAQRHVMAEHEIEEKEETWSTDAGSCESYPSTDETGSDSDSTEAQMESPPDNFRRNLFQKLKLSDSGVWPTGHPASRPKSQAVLIFDWDDTLVCTSSLEHFGWKPLPQKVKQRMSKVAGIVKKVLELACSLGQPFIITNAKEGWVQQSAALWMPEVIPVLEQITVISARSAYEASFPEDVSQWKRQTFLDLQRRLDQHAVTNLIAIGDSDFEMDAAHAMGDKFARAVVKTVKFKPQPNPQELLAELGLVLKRLEHIAEVGHPLQIRIDRSRTGLGC